MSLSFLADLEHLKRRLLELTRSEGRDLREMLDSREREQVAHVLGMDRDYLWEDD